MSEQFALKYKILAAFGLLYGMIALILIVGFLTNTIKPVGTSCVAWNTTTAEGIELPITFFHGEVSRYMRPYYEDEIKLWRGTDVVVRAINNTFILSFNIANNSYFYKYPEENCIEWR